MRAVPAAEGAPTAFPTGTYVDFRRERALALGHYLFALAVFGATFLV